MDMVALSASARAVTQNAKELRRTGIVPCVLYGNDTANTTLQCSSNALQKAFLKAGESTLVELSIDEKKKVPVLFHAVQFEPVSGRIRHVDFYAVDMKKEIEANVPILFTGTAPAILAFQGVFVTVLDHVTVRCLPKDLPHDLPVSVEKLTDLHMQLTIADLPVPSGVKIDAAPETVIATIQEQRKEEEPVPAATAVPAEGEAAAGAEGAPAAEGAEAQGAPQKEEKKEKKK